MATFRELLGPLSDIGQDIKRDTIGLVEHIYIQCSLCKLKEQVVLVHLTPFENP